MKAYLLKESLDRLWNYSYPGAMMRYLQQRIDQLRWQRLQPMEKLGRMLLSLWCAKTHRYPQDSEIARIFVILPDPVESPLAFRIERLSIESLCHVVG